MAGLLQSLSGSPTLSKTILGSLGRAFRPVGEFISPTQWVSSLVFRYKRWDYSKNGVLSSIDASRVFGGNALVLNPVLTENFITLKSHSLDFPIQEATLEDADAEWEISQGSTLLIAAQAQITERTIINALVANGGASQATLLFSTMTNDPVNLLDPYITTMIEAVGSEKIRVLFGANAWQLFKNNANVILRKQDLTWENSPGLFQASAKYMASYAVYSPGLGLGTSSTGYILPPNAIYLFPASDDDDMADPSFMRRFCTQRSVQTDPRQDGHPGFGPVRFYNSESGRDLVVALDFEQLPVVTAPGAVLCLNAG